MGFRTGRKYAITWCKKAETYQLGWNADDVKALKCYDEAIKRDPTFAKPWYEKGKIFADARELPESWTWCHRISPYITGRPAPPYPEEGPMPSKYAETLKMFNKATELDPKFVDAWFAKGDFYSHYQNKETWSIPCYDKVIALDSKYEPAWYGKAEALSELGNHEEVIKCCDKAIRLLPTNAKGMNTDENNYYYSSRWYRKANALSALGKHKEAIKCYDEVLEMKNRARKSYALIQKGTMFAKLGKHKEALEYYNEAQDGELWRRGDVDLVEMNIAKADALSELGGPQKEMLKCYSNAIKQTSDKLVGDIDEWEEGVKKLQEICSRAINGLKKYYDYEE